ncbi:MAG: hypothetical protein J0L61_02235 [Planctomycetes bacterium]|nr:hypothetical protein [Planctomycetota bacterium]
MIDETVRRVRPDDWRDGGPCELLIQQALVPLLNKDADEIKRLIAVI